MYTATRVRLWQSNKRAGALLCPSGQIHALASACPLVERRGAPCQARPFCGALGSLPHQSPHLLWFFLVVRTRRFRGLAPCAFHVIPRPAKAGTPTRQSLPVLSFSVTGTSLFRQVVKQPAELGHATPEILNPCTGPPDFDAHCRSQDGNLASRLHSEEFPEALGKQ